MSSRPAYPRRVRYPRPSKGFMWRGTTIQCKKCAADDTKFVHVCDESRAEQTRLIDRMTPSQYEQYERELQ